MSLPSCALIPSIVGSPRGAPHRESRDPFQRQLREKAQSTPTRKAIRCCQVPGAEVY